MKGQTRTFHYIHNVEEKSVYSHKNKTKKRLICNHNLSFLKRLCCHKILIRLNITWRLCENILRYKKGSILNKDGCAASPHAAAKIILLFQLMHKYSFHSSGSEKVCPNDVFLTSSNYLTMWIVSLCSNIDVWADKYDIVTVEVKIT